MRLLKPQIGGDDESMHGWHWSVSDRNKARYFNDLCDLHLTQQDQHQEHDQNYAAQPHAGMAIAVAIAAKTAAEAAQEENNQDNDEYRSKRHDTLPETWPRRRKTPRGPKQSTFRAASPRSAERGCSSFRGASKMRTRNLEIPRCAIAH